MISPTHHDFPESSKRSRGSICFGIYVLLCHGIYKQTSPGGLVAIARRETRSSRVELSDEVGGSSPRPGQRFFFLSLKLPCDDASFSSLLCHSYICNVNTAD